MTAANGIPMARCGHRREYSRGVSAHVAGDFAVALRAFRAGARRGYAPAQFVLGSMYHKGQGVVADRGEAFFWYLAAADKGEPRAAYVLGCMYCMGEVFDEDPVDQAIQWFRQSAEWGYAPAQFSLGTMFASGTDIPRDPHKATKWFLLAAVQGHRQALLELQAVAASTKRKQPAPEMQ